MRNKFFIFLLFVASRCLSQTGWQEWERVYSDENMVVEFQIYFSENSCDDDGKLFKYRTRLTGRYKTRPNYVNWDMNYIDCNNNLAFQQISAELWTTTGGMVDGLIFESLDNCFQASTIIQPYYNVLTSRNKNSETGLMPLSYSVKPLRIDTITFKNLTTLLVTGVYLGKEAEWCWHENSCDGKLIGKGKRLRVKPKVTTTYFVRAEGEGCITECAQISIFVKPIEVVSTSTRTNTNTSTRTNTSTNTSSTTNSTTNTNASTSTDIEQESETCTSIAATGILAPHALCSGDAVVLRVVEGRLEPNSVWAWYAGNDFTKRIGTGDSIVVNPVQKTMYCVRAEGESDTSEQVSTEINILEPSTESFAIVYKGKATVCEGEKVEMEVDNYVIDDDGIWNWYLDSINGKIVASGAFVEFYPLKTSTYYLRRDGTCNASNGSSRTIFVTQHTDISLAHIVRQDTVYRWRNTSLTIRDGVLGKDAKWYWYKDTCTVNKFLGNGDSMKVFVWKATKYFVKGIGPCYETDCIVIKIKPFRSPLKRRKS